MRFLHLGKKLALSFRALTLILGLGTAMLAPVMVGTASAAAAAGNSACTGDVNSGLAGGAACSQATGTSSNLFGSGGIFQTIANTLIFLVGAIAVLFLIIGGLRYVISNGDPKAVEAAKNTILYAIIGIVIAILSFAAVQFVINTFTSTS